MIAPEKVSLLDVVTAVDGPVLDPPTGVNGNSEELALAWRNVGESLSEVLRGVSIQAVLDSETPSNMYFI